MGKSMLACRNWWTMAASCTMMLCTLLMFFNTKNTLQIYQASKQQPVLSLNLKRKTTLQNDQEGEEQIVLREEKNAIQEKERKKKKNLVIVNSLGHLSTLWAIHYNLMTHFFNASSSLDDNEMGDWDCIIFSHAHERDVPSTHSLLVDLIGPPPPSAQQQEQNQTTDKQRKKSPCSLVRLPGLYWSHFLSTLTPELTAPYNIICILLDDVFAPQKTVDTRQLLNTMKRHDLSILSPSVKGSAWAPTQPSSPRQAEKCLVHVHHVETFFQFMKRETFDCWRRYMEYTNPQAFCLDICLRQLCLVSNATTTQGDEQQKKEPTMAVDKSMTVYHVGRQYFVDRWVPVEYLPPNFVNNMRRDYPPGVGYQWEVCQKYNCPIYNGSIPQRQLYQKPIACTPP